MIGVFGEALVDLVPTTCMDATGYIPRAGGSPCNLAVGLARLEVPVRFFGRISSDPFGRLLRRHLESNGVDTRSLVEGPENTTLAFVHEEPGEEASYLFYAENSADRNLHPGDLPAEFEAEIEALHFGSLSLVLEPGASTLEAVIQSERGRRLLSLDPNVRPRMIPDREAYRERLESMIAAVDLVKVSTADLAWLHPGEAAESVAGRWLDMGPALVLVTRGADGSSAHAARAAATAATASVEVADTVGAGDAFMAAALAWLQDHERLARARLTSLEGRDLEALLAYANRASAITCSRAGADPPWRWELAASG